MFVAEEGVNSVAEIPFSSSGHGAPITLSTAFLEAADVVADVNANLYIDGLWEMTYTNGSHSAPLAWARGSSLPPARTGRVRPA